MSSGRPTASITTSRQIRRETPMADDVDYGALTVWSGASRAQSSFVSSVVDRDDPFGADQRGTGDRGIASAAAADPATVSSPRLPVLIAAPRPAATRNPAGRPPRGSASGSTFVHWPELRQRLSARPRCPTPQ